MDVPLGVPWRPDASPLANPALVAVRNAIYGQNQWQAQPSLGSVATQAILPPLQGLFSAARSAGDMELFVARAGKIYRIPGRTDPLADASKAGNYYSAPDARWRVVQFGSLLIATNWHDEIQAYDLLAGGLFGDLDVSAPRCKYIAVVKDFPVAAFTNDAIDGDDGYAVWWPGFTNGLPDPTNWTPNVSSQADKQRLSDIGIISGITGGEFGTIVGESGVVVMSYGDLLYRFDTRERRIGCRVPNSINQYRQITFFISPEGFMAFDGNAVRPIGAEKVDRWFADDFDETYADRMWTALETTRGDVLWAYCGAGHNGEPNRLIRYSVPLDEFSVSDIDLYGISSGKTFGLSLDDPYFSNLDLFPDNLDDPSYWSSLPQLVAVNQGTLQAFVGAPLEGRFEIPEFQAGGEEHRVMLRKAMIKGQGGTSAVSMFSRDRFDDPGIWTEAYPQQSDGWIRFRAAGRSHRSRVIRGGQWVDLVSVSFQGDGLGKR